MQASIDLYRKDITEVKQLVLFKRGSKVIKVFRQGFVNKDDMETAYRELNKLLNEAKPWAIGQCVRFYIFRAMKTLGKVLSAENEEGNEPEKEAGNEA